MFNLEDEIFFCEVTIKMYQHRLDSAKKLNDVSDKIYYHKTIKRLKEQINVLHTLENRRNDIEIAVYDFLVQTWDYTIDMALEMVGDGFCITEHIHPEADIVIHYGTREDEDEPIIKWEYVKTIVNKYIERKAR